MASVRTSHDRISFQIGSPLALTSNVSIYESTFLDPYDLPFKGTKSRTQEDGIAM